MKRYVLDLCKDVRKHKYLVGNERYDLTTIATEQGLSRDLKKVDMFDKTSVPYADIGRDEGKFVAETVLPETDHDAVRIMTIHAAKGLQFPITIVSGLSSKPTTSRGRRVVWPEGTWALSEPDDPTYPQFQQIHEHSAQPARLRRL